MILTDDQLESTRRWIARFEESLAGANDSIRTEDASLRRVYQAAFARQLNELRAQVTEYEALRSGQAIVFRLSSLADLPLVLINARIAKGLTQRHLAVRLEVDVDRLAADEESGYESAPLAYLIEVTEALRLAFGTEIALPTRAA